MSFSVTSRRRGSSPLTRGKRGCVPDLSPGDGLIPAHAGKTGRQHRRAPQDGAHPRSRGENITPRPRVVRVKGSSPLTRGKPSLTQLNAQCPRLIPAHAGKTPGDRTRLYTHRAHPRSRGENKSRLTKTSHFLGSSPLTRGKPVCVCDSLCRIGLIPAHAGKT